jgi:hypothetical protein
VNVNLICLSWLNTKYLNTCTIIPILLWKHVTSRNRSSQIHPIYHIEYYQKVFLFSSLIICFYHELIYNYFAVFIKNKVAALNFFSISLLKNVCDHRHVWIKYREYIEPWTKYRKSKMKKNESFHHYPYYRPLQCLP